MATRQSTRCNRRSETQWSPRRSNDSLRGLGEADGPSLLTVTDLGLVAFLQLRGLPFDLDRSDFPTRFVFHSPAAEQLARQYWDRTPESLVPAQALVAALQGIKSQIFRRGHNPGRRLDIGDAHGSRT